MRPGALLEDFEKTFRQALLESGITLTYEEYVRYGTLGIAALAVLAFLISIPLHTAVLRLRPDLAIVLSLLLTVVAASTGGLAFIYIPFLKRSSRAQKIDASLYFTTGYMASLAAARIPLEKLLMRVAELEDNRDIRQELNRLVTDITLFGYDTATALERAQRRSPSERLKLFFLGVRDAFLTSGDLKRYLLFTSNRLVQAKITQLRSVLNQLSLLAELYVTLMVATPLMFIIMLAVLSLLPGGVAGIDPVILVVIAVFLVIPASAVSILVLLDAVLSKV